VQILTSLRNFSVLPFRHDTASRFDATEFGPNADFFYFQATEMADQTESRLNDFELKDNHPIHRGNSQ